MITIDFDEKGREEVSSIIRVLDMHGSILKSKPNPRTGEEKEDPLYELCRYHENDIRDWYSLAEKRLYHDSYRDDTLYIYTHGFLSPAETAVCRQILDVLPNAGYYHWSDIDCGGIRIFQFMRDHIFPSVTPLNMDEKTYDKCMELFPGSPLVKTTRAMLENMECRDMSKLKDRILTYGVTFEQEAMLEIPGIWDMITKAPQH